MPFDPKTYVLVHVVLSMVGVFAGLIVVGGLMAGVCFRRWVDVFLTTTFLATVTGFGFPFARLLPSHIVGAISLPVLFGAASAVYWKRLEGAWRQTFVVLSVFALYLNVFVLVAQLFQKIPAMAMLAPSPAAPAFAATQTLALILFVVLGWASVEGFKKGRAPGFL